MASTRSLPTDQQQQTLQNAFDHGLWYLLSLWQPLSIAVRDNWGGPDSSSKRDWFVGAVSDLFTSRPSTDHEDLVMFLLQVMQDEFDCNVEDDSEEVVAGEILALRRRVWGEEDDGGDAAGVVKELEERWRRRGQVKVEFEVQGPDGEEYDDDDEEEDEEEDGGVDVPMADVHDLGTVGRRARIEPEVDEEGFTKVVGKKKR